MTRLHDLAREVYAEHGLGDDAEAELFNLAAEDPTLYREVLAFACKEALLDAQYAARRVIAGKKQPHRPKVYTERQQAVIRIACGRWHQWPLMDGTPLGKANRAMLLRDINKRAAMIKGIANNQRFEELIVARLKDDDQLVEDVLTEAQLSKLMDAALSMANE